MQLYADWLNSLPPDQPPSCIMGGIDCTSAPLAPSSMLGPVTLFDGSIVDPSTIATTADCIPGQCGWGDENYKLWCASSGQVGNRTCDDPACEPYCPS